MTESLDALHSKLIEILDELDRVFTEHDIPYYLGGGCGIGVVRHQGFIPWDDDADIAIYVEDLPRINKALEELDPEKFIIAYPHTGDYCKDYYTIARRNTTYIVRNNLNEPQRISVEMHVMHNVPDSKFKLSTYHTAMKIYLLMSVLSDSMPKRANWILSRIMRKYALFLDLLSSDSSGEYVEPRNVFYKRDILSRKVYGTPTRMDFEKRKYCFPELIDPYLKKLYKNYMELPPADKRVPRQYYALETEVDFEDYASKHRSSEIKLR